MTTYERAAAGDLNAQRQLCRFALDHHSMGIPQGLDDALNWGRMAAAHGEDRDLSMYETVLLRRLLRAQFTADVERRLFLMAEALSFFDRRIDAGDANAAHRMQTLVRTATAEELMLARSWIGNGPRQPRHDEPNSQQETGNG